MSNSNYFKIRNELLPTLSRTSPSIIPLVILLYSLSDPSFHSFYFLGLCILTFIANPIIKNFIAKPLYTLSGKKEISILGTGMRPNGATSCGFSLDNIKAISFGMPSGHSQIIWTIGTYLIARGLNKMIKDNENKIVWSVMSYIWFALYCLVLLCIMIYIPYTRVYIEGCHTLQQVIVGGIIGIGFGLLGFFMEDTIRNAIQ